MSRPTGGPHPGAERFADRFNPERYRGGDVVRVAVVRGRDDSGADGWIPGDVFQRAILLGVAYELPQLSRIDVNADQKLTASQARELSEEIGFLDAIVDDPLIGPHLQTIRTLADSCWRSAVAAVLEISGP